MLLIFCPEEIITLDHANLLLNQKKSKVTRVLLNIESPIEAKNDQVTKQNLFPTRKLNMWGKTFINIVIVQQEFYDTAKIDNTPPTKNIQNFQTEEICCSHQTHCY